MCELLGLNFNEKVSSTFSFRGFRNRGEYNPSGWGIAYYKNLNAQIIKEPISSAISTKAKSLISKNSVKSKIFISHVRNASIGAENLNNTHPFKRELNGKDYVFAHNGTIKNFKFLKLSKFNPDGETDSEYIFCYLMDKISEKNIVQWNEKYFDWLHEQLLEINSNGSLNCLMSDGEHLFCYRDKNGWRDLNYVFRKSPFEVVSLVDEDFEINLAEEKRPTQRGYIIATDPITDENWEKISNRTLMVFKDGDIVYSK
jgi:glutamine amidotransferase